MVFIDPVNGNDANNGTTFALALKTFTQAFGAGAPNIVQSAGGDQVNIANSGTATLAAVIALTTYGTPITTKPLIFRGCTAAANDGGIGVISGNAGNFSIFGTTNGFVFWKDLRLTNCGTATILAQGASGAIEHCEVDTTTGIGLNVSAILNNYLHDIGSATAMVEGCAQCLFNRFETLGKNPGNVIDINVVNGIAHGNTVAITAAATTTNGILLNGNLSMAFGNSVWANAGKGAGILNNAVSKPSVFSNIVEGFSGVGGKGISDGGTGLLYEGLNFLFNNTTEVSLTGAPSPAISFGADTTTGSSSFNNPSATPNDLSLSTAGITACKAQAYPGAYIGGTGFSTASPFTSYRDAGAVQHQDAGGGGGGSCVGDKPTQLLA